MFPRIDPDVLFLVVLGGAVVGALTAGLSYVGIRIAEEQGVRTRFLPELPPYLEHETENSNGASA